MTNFMTHFHELVSLYCVLLCDCGRGDGLGFAGFDFRFRWSSGRPLLCSFRKRVFQEVSYKTSLFCFIAYGGCSMVTLAFCGSPMAFLQLSFFIKLYTYSPPRSVVV